MIEFKHVTKRYTENLALDDFNLTINDQELFVLVGPSGSGKTTTLKMINRLITPSAGEIIINQKNIENYDLRQLRLKMGYVLQNIALFPNLTIEDNIAIQPEALHWPKKKRLERSRQLLSEVDLDPNKYATRFPDELSGGEQQRVGIVRALATDPQIVLMDEPFSALDPISRKQLQDLVLKIHEQLHLTIVFVTHDMNEALRLGTRIAVMRNGHILQVGTANEITNHPVDSFVESFFSTQSHLPDIKIQALIHEGYDELPNPNGTYLTLGRGDSISALAQALKGKNDGVKVTKEDGIDVVINTGDLLSFIAEKRV